MLVSYSSGSVTSDSDNDPLSGLRLYDPLPTPSPVFRTARIEPRTTKDALSGQSRERTAPERIDVNAYFGHVFEDPSENALDPNLKSGGDIIANLGALPGRVLEMPFSWANRVTGGGIDAAIAEIGKTEIGRGLGVVNDILDNSSKLASAGINAVDLQLQLALKGLPDDTRIPVSSGGVLQTIVDVPANLGNALVGRGWIGGTAGGLRKEMAGRGFTPEELASLDGAAESNGRGLLDYGDHPSSSNPLVAMATSQILNPTNLLFLVPGAGVARGAAAARGVRPITEGIGMAEELRAMGIVTEVAPDAVTAARAVAAGQVSGVTVKGIGLFVARSLANPGTLLPAKLIKGYAAASIATSAATAALDVTTDWLSPKMPDGSLAPGFLKDLHDFASDIINDHPLSEGAAYNYFAAFHFPARDLASSALEKVAGGARSARGGLGTLNEFANVFSKEKTLPLRKADFLERIGGTDGFTQLVGHLADKITLERMAPTIKADLSAIDNAASREATLHELVHTVRDDMLLKGKISSRDLLQTMKDWWGLQGGMASTGVHQPWSADAALRHWTDTWIPVQNQWGSLAFERGSAVVGLQDKLTIENIRDIKAGFRAAAAANGGVVPLEVIRDFRQKFPQLVANHSVFAKYAVPDAVAPRWATIRDELTRAGRNAPSQAELTHELTDLERDAPPPIEAPRGPLTDDGIAEPAGHREITDEYARDVLGTAPEPVVPAERLLDPDAPPSTARTEAPAPAFASELDRFHQELRDAGAPRDSADAARALIEARARRLGVTPDSLVESVRVEALNEVPGSSQLQRVGVMEERIGVLEQQRKWHQQDADGYASAGDLRKAREAQRLADRAGGDIKMYRDRIAAMGDYWYQAVLEAPPSGEVTLDQLNAPAPEVLVDAGLGESSPLVPFDLPDGKILYVPGGMEGTFSYWDSWRLMAQGIDPAIIPDLIRAPLYEKIFRTMDRSLETDPLDAANRMIFAQLSPGTNLTDNAALYGRVRVTNMADAQALADIAAQVRATNVDVKKLPSEIGYQVQRSIGLADMKPAKPGQPRNIRSAVSRSTNVQLGNIALFMEKFVERPDFFLKKPGESLQQYTERLINATPGAAYKVGNFSVMAGNPSTHPIGTIDSHVMEILGLGDTSPGAQPVAIYLADGSINPALPAHLRDLPWMPDFVPGKPMSEQPTFLVLGAGYGKANTLLEGHMLADRASSPRPVRGEVGGFQWYRWDPKRRKLEPHQYMYPGAYRLPRQPLEEANAAYATLSGAGFTGRGNTRPFPPTEGLLYQGDPALARGFTVRRGADTLIGLTEAADATTALHELWHGVLQPSLTNAERAILEKHNAVDERGARLFEKYLSTGKAPIPDLQAVFDRIRAFFADVYAGIKGTPLGMRLHPDVKEAFDSLFTPDVAKVAKDETVKPGTRVPNPELLEVGRTYNQGFGLPDPVEGRYAPLNEDFSRRTARAYEALPVTDDASRRSYASFVQETLAQYEALKKAGYTFTPSLEDPYTPTATMTKMQLAAEDVAKNKHLYVFAGSLEHPLLTPQENWIFRGVHDMFGHLAEGYSIGPRGEYNAAIKHSQMYSPAARPAMLAETHGQNSVVNFSDTVLEGQTRSIAEVNREKPGSLYADQKATVLPPDLVNEFHTHAAAALEPHSEARVPTLEETAPIRAAQDAAQGATPEQVQINYQRDIGAADALDENTGINWRGRPMSRSAAEDLTSLDASLRAAFPGYRIEFPPRIATVLRSAEITNPQLVAQLTRMNGLYEWLRYSSPLSPLGNALSLLLEPVPNQRMSDNQMQAIYNYALPLGAKPAEINAIVRDLKQRADEMSLGFGSMHMKLFAKWDQLLPAQIEKIAESHLKTAYPAIKAEFGGFTKLIDRAGNRVIQQARIAAREGGVVGDLGSAIEGWYGAYQNSVGRPLRYIKGFYPIFRFLLSPRYWAMNAMEATILGQTKYGTGHADGHASISYLAHEYRSSTPSLRLAQEAAEVATVDDASPFMVGRKMQGYIQEAFDSMRPESAQAVIDGLAKNAPELVYLQQRFGPNKGTWAEQLDQMLYSFDTQGVAQTLQAEAARILRQEDLVRMGPILQRLYEINEGHFQAVKHTFQGNHSRSNLERVLNSYFLFWPLSYQLKAGKWLFDVMTERAFGRKTNFAGAYAYSQLLESHKEMLANDPDYKAMFEDNPTLWFTAGMIFPLTPGDMGVSLNRGLRYAGGALGIWGAYKESSDPVAAAQSMLTLGLNYDVQLLRRIWSDFNKKKPAPKKTRTIYGGRSVPPPTFKPAGSFTGLIVQP